MEEKRRLRNCWKMSSRLLHSLAPWGDKAKSIITNGLHNTVPKHTDDCSAEYKPHMTVLHLSIRSDLHLPQAILLVMTRSSFRSILKKVQYFLGVSNCNYDDKIPNSFVFVQGLEIYFFWVLQFYLSGVLQWNDLLYLHNSRHPNLQSRARAAVSSWLRHVW